MTHSGAIDIVIGMKPGARAAAMAVFGLACLGAMPVRAEAERVHGCMSPNKAREVLVNQKFVAPFRALSEAARSAQGDAVGVQLCLLDDDFVYDVTVLRRDGRVSHTLVNARNGDVVPARTAK